MKKILLITIIIITYISNAFSQKQWTLEECINYALENNLQIKSQNLDLKISDNQKTGAKLSYLPSFNAGASQNFVFGRSVDPYTNEFSSDNFNSSNFQISSSITLFEGLKNFYNLKKSDADNEASQLQLETLKNNIILNIAGAYLNILYANNLIEIAKSQEQITIEQLEKVKIMVKEGSLPLQNQYDLEAQLANDEYNIVNYENQYKNALLNLAQLMELPNEEIWNFEISKPEIQDINEQILLTDINDIYQQALQKMPEIEYARQKSISAEYNSKISRAMLMPRLNLSGSYGTGYSSARKEIINIIPSAPYISGFTTDRNGNILDVYQYSFNYSYATKPFVDQIKENASASLMFNLSIPIFNSYQSRINYRNSNIYFEQTKIQEEQSKKDLLKTIQQAYLDLQSAYKQMEASEKNMKAAKINFEYTQKRYEQGLIAQADYNISKNNLYKTEVEYIRSKYDFVFKNKILDFYRGIPIKL